MNLFLRLSACVSLCISAATSTYAETFTSDGIIYSTTGESTCEVARQNPDDVIGKITLASTVTDDNGTSYMLTSISDFAFVTCSQMTEVTIPASVTNLGNSSFSKCKSLSTVRFDGAPILVGSNCFSESDGISSVYTPDLESWISTDFKNASASPLHSGAILYDNEDSPISITSIPEGTKRIGAYSLSNIKEIEIITLPTGLEEIGNGAFEGCPIKTVDIPSLGDWLRISFGNYTANPLFRGNVELVADGVTISDIDIPSDITEVKSYAFMNYLNVASITISGGVKEIGAQAFSGCTNVRTMSLGENLEKIGMNAFQEIDFTDITSLATTPPSLSGNVFSNTAFSDASLKVPIGSVDAYRKDRTWNKFNNISETPATGIDYIIDVTDTYVRYFDLTGVEIKGTPSKGIFIRVQDGKAEKIVIQ